MEVMVAMGMAVVTMARGRLKLSQDILEVMVAMVTDVDMEVMDMDVGIMARGRLKLNQDILEDMVVMVMVGDMVVMDMDVDIMARGRLKLNQDISEDMVVMAVDMEVMGMVDMAIMVKPTFEFYSQIYIHWLLN